MYRRLICLVTLALILGPIPTTWAAGDSSLVGWWKLDETAGSVAADSSGMGNDGEVFGGAQWGEGQIKGGLTFDGTDDYVDLPIGPLVGTLTNCSVALWANFSQAGGGWQRLWDIGNGSGSGYMFVTPSVGNPGGLLRFAITTASWGEEQQVSSSGTLETGWHHVTVTIDADNDAIRLYLDGEVMGENLNADLTPSDLGETTQNWLGRSQYAADSYYQGSLDDFRIYNVALTAEDIALVMSGAGPEPGAASGPKPQNEAVDVRQDVVLNWNAGEYAATHDVYVGTSFDDVNVASRTDPRGVLANENQSATTYDPDGLLTFGQIYYWRIDEVNDPAFGPGIIRGNVWSFTVEPYSYQVTDVNATASIPSKTGSALENILDGSGLNDEGGHSTEDGAIWASDGGGGDTPVSIEFTLDRVYKLDEVRIWNYNHDYEFILNFGVKDVTIEYSTDANEWTVLGDYVLPQGTSSSTFPAEVIDFGGAAAKYVRLNKNTNYGGTQGMGLSEVQFYYVPTFAREPDPEPNTVDVGPDVTLSWRPGREAVSHEVHVSTDSNAVAAGEALADTVSVPSYDTAGFNLLLGEKYYWMVNEVNEAEATPSWASEVWDFNTPDFIAVDDFESYTDEDGSRVYQAWLDGYEDSSNGSIVGNDDPPYADQDNIHSGTQSMPFTFGVNGATTSEAELTLDGAQDWTRAGVQTLVVWFRGSLGNGTPQLYLKVNDTRVDYDGSAGILAGQVWKQWNVDVASLGAAARNAKTLVLGVSGAGAGMLYFDDIRLYRDAPPTTGDAVDPGTANLAAYYPMSDNANDASGHSLDGTVEVGSSFETGPTGYGRAVAFDGTSGYIDLPVGTLVSSLDSITVATWVNRNTTGDGYSRIFDFGTGETVNMWMAPDAYGGLICAITNSGNSEESRVIAPTALPLGWHHVAVTIDGTTSEMNLYLDGSAVDTETTETLPSDLGETTQNWIGRSQYTADPYFTGLFDDFRIYDRALSAEEIQYLAGAR